MVNRLSFHFLVRIIIVTVLSISIVANTTVTPFSVSAQAIIADLPYGGNRENAATGEIIFSIANGSFLSVSEIPSITFRATIGCAFDWIQLPGGGLYDVSYKASWENRSNTVYSWKFNSPDTWMDDDPNPQSNLYHTIDLSNAPIGPQQIEVTATGGGYTTDVVSHWYSFSGSVSASIDFVITSDPSIIEVQSPENKEYTNNSVPLIFRTYEETSWLGYRLDNLDIVTIDGNTTLTGLSDGYHIINVYANGTKWNSGKSDEVIFKVNAQSGGNNSIPSLFWRTGIEWDLSGTPVQDLWEKELEITARTWKTPTIDDGIVYVGIEYRVQVNQYTTYEWIDVNAFNATSGVRLWTYRDISNDRMGRMSTPVVVDGVVYFETFHNIYALKSNDGSLLWNYTTYILDPFTVVTEGKLFAGSQSELFVLNATNGHHIWNYTVNRAINSVFITDGVVYASTNGQILALNETTGEKIWSTDPVDCRCAQVTNGSVYAYSYASVYSFDVFNGSKNWNTTFEQRISVPTVANNTVYLSSYNVLYALDSTSGAELWNLTFEDAVSAPKVVKDFVYLSSDNALYVLSANDGKILWNYTMDGSLGEPVVVNDVVYIKCDDKISAIGLPHMLTQVNDSFPIVFDATVIITVLITVTIIALVLLIYFKKKTK